LAQASGEGWAQVGETFFEREIGEDSFEQVAWVAVSRSVPQVGKPHLEGVRQRDLLK
jgi:hypothetical protein